MTTFHMKQSILGCLRNNRIGTIDFLEDENGNPLSDEEARIELTKLLNKGHTVMPVGDDCEGFDVFGGGCPGHEPLAGKELVKAMLDSGLSKVLVKVSSNGTNDFEDWVITFATKEGGDAVTKNSNTWNYMVPINIQGEPLTAKEVGL